jgi:hypothetical protein
MKTIYSTPAADSSESARISVLQNTLSQLRLANIATLDALMTHFTRLIELTSADETYIAALANALAPCILRPKVETSMTMEEKYAYRLIRDLFAHKDAIFTALKRASSLSHSISVDTRRPRAISTDESNRKANMEARARAIIAAGSGGSRSRATSPAPSPRGHRRDRSSGGPETRFPIQTSPTATADHARHPRSTAGVRQSLEVPNEAAPVPVATEPTNGPPASTAHAAPLHNITNGSAQPARVITSATYVPGMDDGMEDFGGIEKRNSLGKSGVASGGGRYAGRRPVGGARMSQDQGNRESVGSLHDERVGVSLTDKPMDD